VKKLAIILASALFLSGFNLQKYNVGDSMPDYKDGTSLSAKILISKNECPTWIYRYSKDGDDKYAVAFTDKTYSRPFAIYEFKSETLYLDLKENSNKVGHDGKIDSIVKNPLKIKISFYNPECEMKNFGEKF
jgi:hypothetical protein